MANVPKGDKMKTTKQLKKEVEQQLQQLTSYESTLTKEDASLLNLYFCVCEGKATAGTFENHIKKYGLCTITINLIQWQYEDL